MKFFNFERSQGKLAAILIIPTFIAVFLILIYPIIYSFIISFGQVRLSTLGEYNFIGLANYITVLRDPDFTDAFMVSLKFVSATVILKLIIGTLVAVMLKESFVGRSFVRSLVIIPWATPYVVTGIIWKWMLNDRVGLINFLLKKIGIIDSYISFLSSKTFAIPSIILADVWQGTPFFIIIILAGLQTIPDELYEAASIDGSSGIRSFFNITLPMVKLPIYIATILGTLISINSFDLFFILTKGGPGNITTNLTLYNWNNAFKFFDVSYAAAISYIIMLISFIVTIMYFYFIRKSGED
ncbi:MAG: sugar ABC transporter permease [Actinobacteria bacterium]|nr:sugar ABC transporter permease [Actinomycetota bacterium]